MSTGRGDPVVQAPPLTISVSGSALTLHGREATLVIALLRTFPVIAAHSLGEVRLAFSPSLVDAEVSLKVRNTS